MVVALEIILCTFVGISAMLCKDIQIRSFMIHLNVLKPCLRL